MIDNDKNLIAELEKRLCWYRDEATEEEFDPEEVDAICTMLLKLSPIEEPHMEQDEAYRNIMRRVQEESLEKEEEAKEGESDREEAKSAVEKRIHFPEKKRYRAAILFITVFGAAILSLNMVTYAREDKSLFTMILERVGLFEIVKDETEEIVVSSEETNRTFYDSWVELDREVKSRLVIPQYIPNGYELYGVDYYDYINREKVLANYNDKSNGHLVIEITLWENSSEQYKEKAIDESEYVLISEYSNGNTLYYQYDDEYICMASMENGFYRISGNILLEEMIKVREGLGDIEK